MKRSKPNGKVALISMYSSDALGPRYVDSFLKKNGYDVRLIFFKEKFLESDRMSMPTEKEYKLLLDLLKKIDPDIVGMSLRSSFFKIASMATTRIREELGVPVIWGGTHPNVAPEECIKVADMICIGEGEYPMLELIERISKGEEIEDIQNIWIRKGKKIIRNPVRLLIRDLDSLPFPDYGHQGKYLIENESVSSYDPFLERFNLDVIASRGCPYHCTYCCNSVFLEINKGKGPPIRRRSVDNVIEEIQYIRKKYPNFKRIDFIDEVFAWNKAWASEFSAKYSKLINLPFQCSQHPNMVDRDILLMLRKAGLERVDVGIQSGSEHIRKEIFERPVSDKTLIKTARIINDLNIVPFYDFIVDNPFETNEDKRLSLEFLLSLPRPFYLRMFPLTYFPNTELTKKALASKVITEDQVESKAERTHNKWFVTLDYPWSNHERFWISLYSLTSKDFIPKKLIRWLLGSQFFQKRSQFLSAFANLCNNIKLGSIAVKWLFEGKPLKAIFRQKAKGRSHWQI